MRRTSLIALLLALLLATHLNAATTAVLFSDDFANTGSGPGMNWTSVSQGYPNTVNTCILDGSRTVLNMGATNLSPAQTRGMQLVSPISIPSTASALHLDFNFQPRAGGNSSVILSITGANAALRVYTQDFYPRRVSTDGSSTGGTFLASSGGSIYNFYTYYHFTVDICGGFTTIALKSDNSSTVLWSYTTYTQGIADFGNSINLSITQVTGAGDVNNFIDSLTVSSINVVGDVNPGGWAVNSVPSLWNVRYVKNETGPLLTMYGVTSSIQETVQAMQNTSPTGLGDAFDPGPPNGDSASYQYLASQGFPSVTWTAQYLTSPVPTEHVNLLKDTLGNAGLHSSFQFGEWGYAFHTFKPYGPYDGYPVQQTTKTGCYNFLKSAYVEQTANYRAGMANSVTGHSHYESYAAEWGCLMGGIEVGENIAFTQSKIAFARGASRQWNLPWSMQMSQWFSGYSTGWDKLDEGHSLSLYIRMLSHGWFSGAAWLTPENSSAIVFNNGQPANGVNSWGTALAQLNALMKSHNPGTPHTPVGIVLDHYAGYNAYAHKAWGTLPFTAGDTQIDDLFVFQLFPGSDFIHYTPFPNNPEQGFLRETPYGEIYDVLLSSATTGQLQAYPVILLVGDITFDAPFVAALQQAVSNGSRLLMQSTHQTAMGTANFNALSSAGYVEVLPAWINPATGRSAAIPNSKLAEIARNCTPITVSGAPIEYAINRTATGWVVELINNRGVTKLPSTAATTATNATAVVTLTPNFSVAGARRWQIDGNGNANDLDLTNNGSPLTVSVGPGQSTYIEYFLPDSGFTAWQFKYFGSTNIPQAAPTADPLGKGMSNQSQYLAGLDPTNITSVFRVGNMVLDANGHLTVTWSSVGGKTYRVQYSEDISTSGSFTDINLDITDPNPAGTPGTLTFTDDFTIIDPPAAGRRFYRVRVK